jgi:DNA-binding NtrC family response regulator
VYGIVQQSRGFIAVSSAPDQGSRFDVYLPAEKTTGALQSAPQPVAPARPGRHDETILLVEDEEQVRSALRRQLSEAGYSVFAAADGRAASELIAQSPRRIDVLLSDVVMPHVSGPDLARVFRQKFPDSAVLLMSGYSEEAVARQGELDAAAAFIQKPYDFREVVRLLRTVLHHEAPAPAPRRPGEVMALA